MEAAKILAAEGIRARVVSFPSWKLFEEQTAEYKASVLPAGVPKLAVEAGATLGWWKYVGANGDVIGLDRFGASAPGPKVMEKLGFTAENVAARAKKLEVSGVGVSDYVTAQLRSPANPANMLTPLDSIERTL